MRLAAVFALIMLAATPSAAQQREAWDFSVSRPAAGTSVVTRDLTYAGSGETALKLDVYKPSAGAAAAPVVIFLNSGRAHPFFTQWSLYAASQGIVGIMPDIRPAEFVANFDSLLAYLGRESRSLGIDGDRIAVYAPSGIVAHALPAIERAGVTRVKAGVMYYGTAALERYRLDLPVLLVRAGLDRPALNRAIDAMVAAALAQNAPITVLNNPAGYHSFESSNHDDASRHAIDATLDFVRRVTQPAYQRALAAAAPEAAAAGHVLAERTREAAAAYAQLVAARPDAHALRLSYVEALLADGQYAPACREADTLKDKGLGPRDLGLPAARACMLKGDGDAALAWLQTIPRRFMPPSVQQEAVFAPIRDRETFKALFPSR